MVQFHHNLHLQSKSLHVADPGFFNNFDRPFDAGAL
jgi:hypothetical protein